MLVLGPTACGGPPGDGAPAGAAPGAEYWVFAGRESSDVGYRVRFGPEGADAETVPVDELGARVLEAALRFRITAPSGETPDPAMAGDARHHGDDHAGDHAAVHAEHMKDPAHVERHAVRHGGDAAVAVEPRCGPTWAHPAADGEHVFVVCSGTGELLELTLDDLRLTRRLPTGRAPRALVISPDGRFGFVAIGAEAGDGERDTGGSAGAAEGAGGRVEVYDLGTGERVASVAVDEPVDRIAFWKMEVVR